MPLRAAKATWARNAGTVKEAVALLPDVAKIIAKFDFLQAKVTVTQDGQDADSYTSRSVTVVQPADEDDAADEEWGG